MNTWLRAQPAITRRCSAASPARPGTSSSSCSIVRIVVRVARRLTHVRGADRGGLLGDVDRNGAPRDASPATDAAGGPELIAPAGELVRHPLPVARARRTVHAFTVDV